jgi:positive regulator of sigma E activity
MSLQGKVIEVLTEHVIVEVVPRPECKGCHACTGLLDGEKRSAVRQIKALNNGFSLSPGDEVMIDLNPGQGSIVAILIFGLPIAAFIAGLTLAPQLAIYSGFELTDLFRVVTGFLSMALIFVLLAWFSRTRHVDRLSMRVMKKIERNNG